MRKLKDRIGLGWRTEIAAHIYSHLDEIDVVEIILDDLFQAPESKISALRYLATQIPVVFHGVGLGVASSIPADPQHLKHLARTLRRLEASEWSEHLSFVRAGKIEIGHLAAPPRSEATIAGTIANLRTVKAATGSLPALENIATLIDPPGSTMSEAAWTTQILQAVDGELLLDLHNLYSNALNFGFDPAEYLRAFPLHRVKQIHLSGGHWIPEKEGIKIGPAKKRLLDDHLHDVPDAVFDLLAMVAREVPQPLTVLIERDGAYPDFAIILQQLRRTRETLKAARSPKENHERAGI